MGDAGVTVLRSDDFWAQITGIADCRARLLKASMILAALISQPAQDQVARIRTDASGTFGVASRAASC